MKAKQTEFEKYLEKKRGYVSRFPKNKKAVVIISGGLDSTITSARLIEEYKIELFPLHIQRGQTNSIAEDKSVDYFTKYFQKKYGKNKFHTPEKVSVNVPPREFKVDLLPYTKLKGYPMRDPIMHLLAVEYAVTVSQKFGTEVKTIFCAIVPEDYFPHSTLDGLRVNTINTCVNMDDWDWQISSPNIDPYLTKKAFNKSEEIKWAMVKNIPVGKTVSCNDASENTNYLACGKCKSCFRRNSAFTKLGFGDPTKYYEEPDFKQFS